MRPRPLWHRIWFAPPLTMAAIGAGLAGLEILLGEYHWALGVLCIAAVWCAVDVIQGVRRR